MAATLNHLPLSGIRVLDLTRVLAGPYCTMTLGDLGADVIKIENPKGGDDTRAYPPLNEDRESVYFLSTNRNKRSVTIDISKAEGQQIVRKLAATSDVLIENYREGTLRRYCLDYDDLRTINPGIIFCSISGFGRNSIQKERPGYDFVAQAEGGLMSLTGERDGPPVKVGVPISDITAGMNATQAILAALFNRERTGEGQLIDIALLDTVVCLTLLVSAEHLETRKRPGRFANAHPAIVPYEAFHAKDADFVLAVANDSQFKSFCQLIGEPELAGDPRYITNTARVQNRVDLVTHLNALFARDTADTWLDRLNKAGIPAGRIRYIDEVLNAPEVLDRELVQTIPSQFGKPIQILGSPLKLRGTPQQDPTPPPLLGEHTVEVLQELLGMTPESIKTLQSHGIVGGH